MKKLTKQNIEELAQEIITFLEKEHLAGDVSIYFNNKVMRSKTDWDKEGDRYTWKITDNIDPHDYFEYAAYDHILSMSFEGGLYDVLNYYDSGRREEEFRNIFEKYGLYFEFGNAWNLSAYPNDDDMEIEFTKYERPKETIYLRRMSTPFELEQIMTRWYHLSKAEGEGGSCVLGAGFEFEWEDNKYFMPAQSPYQGSLSWEAHKDEIKKMLEDIGATAIYYKWGNMD